MRLNKSGIVQAIGLMAASTSTQDADNYAQDLIRGRGKYSRGKSKPKAPKRKTYKFIQWIVHPQRGNNGEVINGQAEFLCKQTNSYITKAARFADSYREEQKVERVA